MKYAFIIVLVLSVFTLAGGATIDVFTINEQARVGCNMCALACPVEGCITMKEVPTGKEPMNWKQYQARLADGTMQKIPPKQPTKS